jgi:hypothetical protein
MNDLHLALIAITGARFGNGRLIIPAGWPCTPVYRISGTELSLEFYNVSIPSGIGLMHSAPDEILFSLKLIMVDYQIK